MARLVRTDGADPAVRQARRVVGLYGDPRVSWSIVMGVDLAETLQADGLQRRFGGLVASHPHLGRLGEVEVFQPESEGEVLSRIADEEYGDRSPLVRIGLRTDGRRLLVGAHHGVMDGLGMLGALTVLLGTPVTSEARGVTTEAERGGFWLAGVRRLAEALFRPPCRVVAPHSGSGRGDELVSRRAAGHGVGTAGLVLATRRGIARWNSSRGARTEPLVVAVGLSRRPGVPTPAPNRDTAYARLSADAVRDLDSARVLLRTVRPEPAFPVMDGRGLVPRMISLLSDRLGATVLVSNVGRVRAAGVEALDFWPVPTGPAGVAVGLATAGGEVRLTVRTRHAWFDSASAADLADILVSELASVQ